MKMCPYTHKHTQRFASSSAEPCTGQGQRCAAGPAEHPPGPLPPGFSRERSCPPPWTPRHNMQCPDSRHSSKRFLLLSFHCYCFVPRFSLFFVPLLPWLIPSWSHPGETQKCKNEGKTPGNPRNFKAMFPITGKPATNKSLLQFVKARKLPEPKTTF